jgi:branched-chain amino acid transport system substrate-binding protein
VNKKVLFGLIALVLVVLVVLPLCSACTPKAPAKDKIVVGMARPLSGGMAIIGDSGFKPIYETFIPEVNAAGGLFIADLGKKLPLETLIYDDKSDVGTMTRLTEKLILEDKVDFLWPSCGTSFIFGQAPIANKYNYLLLTAEGGATTITDSLYSLPYTFISLSYSDWYQLPVWADMVAAAGAKTAYVTYIADLHGIEYAGVAGKEFSRVGIKIVGNVSLPPTLKDFAPIILDAQASGADVFCCFAYPDQVMPVTGTAIALGYNPKAMIMGPGGNFGFYHTTFGPATEGVCAFDTYSRKQSPAMNALADKLYTGKPEEAQDWWGHSLYWAAWEYWKQAVEKAGTLDQTAIRNVFATEHFNTVLGDTSFTVFGNGGGIMAKESHNAEIGQWQSGIFESVGGGPWPNTKLTAPFVYPKPAFPK